MDGRKRRWHQHKVDRRNELVDGTIDAIRRLGGAIKSSPRAGEPGASALCATTPSSIAAGD